MKIFSHKRSRGFATDNWGLAAPFHSPTYSEYCTMRMGRRQRVIQFWAVSLLLLSAIVFYFVSIN